MKHILIVYGLKIKMQTPSPKSQGNRRNDQNAFHNLGLLSAF